MNVTLRIGKVIRTLGLMGIMLALAGFMAHASSASAGRMKQADSTIMVYPIFPSSVDETTTAAVMIYDSNGYPVAKGTATGKESYAATLAPGGYTVSVFAEGFSDYTEVVKLGGGENFTVMAPLTALVVMLDGTVAVKVIVPGTNLEYGSAEVRIRDENNNLVAEGTVDREQNFVATLAPGIYIVTASAQGYNEYSEAVEVTSAEIVSVTAYLTR